jgi:putative membrane protein
MWNDGWTHDEMMGGAYGGWHWLFGFHGLLSIVFVAVIIFAVVALVRDSRRRDGESPAQSALGTRYAQGEISRDEYLETKRNLKA